jgi:hypothetical protein
MKVYVFPIASSCVKDSKKMLLKYSFGDFEEQKYNLSPRAFSVIRTKKRSITLFIRGYGKIKLKTSVKEIPMWPELIEKCISKNHS